jgi:hypothetical protein
MTKPLKPVSEAMRRALALLGETPEEHQREKLEKRAGGAQKKQPFVSSKLESTSSVAARLIAKTPEPIWLADAYVLFTRTRTCRCGVVAHEMHYTETFIRQRSKIDGRTLKYIPARSSLFADLKLPKITINTPVKTFYCPSCWADEQPLENPVCLSELVTLPKEPTESSSDTTAPTNGSAGPLPSGVTSSPNPNAASASDSSQASPSSIAGLALSLAHLLGSTFGSSADAPSASARLTPILIA